MLFVINMRNYKMSNLESLLLLFLENCLYLEIWHLTTGNPIRGTSGRRLESRYYGDNTGWSTATGCTICRQLPTRTNIKSEGRHSYSRVSAFPWRLCHQKQHRIDELGHGGELWSIVDSAWSEIRNNDPVRLSLLQDCYKWQALRGVRSSITIHKSYSSGYRWRCWDTLHYLWTSIGWSAEVPCYSARWCISC